MQQLTIINRENVSEEEVKNYSVREASRAVVLDETNLVALLHVVKENYYKLPGGGIEESEDRKVALQRECEEEIGSAVEVVEEIGSIVEYRKIFHLKQVSYCYLAKIKGKKGVSNFTGEELEKGFQQVWLSYKKALQTITKSSAMSFEGSAYIVPRDIAFLRAAKRFIVR